MAGMKDTFRIINRMVEDGVIGRYAVCGAVAALNYIEPTLTQDLDVLVSVDDAADRPRSGLVTLGPLFAYLRKAGYRKFKKEGIVIEGWPVQFLPVADDLDAESLAEADEIAVEAGRGRPPIRIRTLRAEHVVATALRVGRPKDRVRIGQFLAEDAVDLTALGKVLDRHRLREAWAEYCAESGIRDPLGVKSKR